MLDFYEIRVKKRKQNHVITYEIYPEFLVDMSDSLMIRGKDFYAAYDDKSGMWMRNPKFIKDVIDADLWKKYEEVKEKVEAHPTGDEVHYDVKSIKDYRSGSWETFNRYVKSLPDDFHQLDEKVVFQNTKIKKTDYVSKRLPYSLEHGDISAYEEMMSVLYSPSERRKFEWAIGSIIAGDSKRIQKFIVFYGPMGSGKSTVMNLIEKLFGGYDKYKGYCAKINAKALTGSNVGFALEPFSRAPLVGIDQDSKLSRIEDNTTLNQIVSHDMLQINEKYKNLYESSSGCMLFMGTNEPVKITDSKSGIIRRLIDVEPTGELISPESRYMELVSKMDYELGSIAQHCLDVYKSMGPAFYSSYRPTRMMERTDHFYNFMKDSMETFVLQGGTTANELWSMYKAWCEDSGVDIRLKRFQVTDEARNYFESYDERPYVNGKQIRNWYSGLKQSKFSEERKTEDSDSISANSSTPVIPEWLQLKEGIHSKFDDILIDCKAAYGDDKPNIISWNKCKTTLKDIDTTKTHFVQVPEKLISLDFDKKNESGEKDFTLNAIAASKYPKTYAETSKGGSGIHLEYWYDGDPDTLSRIIDEGIECKVQKGDASLRRRLSRCNSEEIAHISSGLPLKSKKLVNDNALKDAKHLRSRVLKALRKEIEPGYTTTCINYIESTLLEAQEKGIPYDIKDLDSAIFSLAASSTNNKDGCLKKYYGMKLIWPEITITPEPIVTDEQKVFVPNTDVDAPIVFCDIEVAKNLLMVCYKEIGEGKDISTLFNPKPYELEALFKMRLAGFNCRTYDGPILYARYIGYSTMDCYNLSRDIIVNDVRTAFQRDSENVFDIDIYDYSTNKQSLKKWEIQLGIPHMEMEVDWNEPIPEEMWPKLAEYCKNDVIATEAVFNATQEDFTARKIMCELTGMPLITTTNQLSAAYIFGDVKEPWHEFVYPDLKSEFPGYKFENGKSYFNDVLIGEGGRVYANPGIYYDVKTFDVASMHPSSIIAENGFGPYTEKFKQLMDIRIAIKHKEFDKVKELNPSLCKYLNDPAQAKGLAVALKIVINSVYGLTAAKFQNKFKDPRNVDNWVAKRGALFMETLRLKVQEMGATVVHIKTDSIKIANPTFEIEDFIINYGKQWGYNFEVESIYDRICLVNDAVYIAKCSDSNVNGDEASHWTATGAQFQHPYIFKTLFSKEKVKFIDLCEQRAVKTDIWLDMNEDLEDAEPYEKELTKIEKKLISDDDPTLKDRAQELKNKISSLHKYKFIGRVGLFCPILPGKGGGILLRKGTDGKYSSVTGSKGWRWMEASDVADLNYQQYIDMSYFHDLASVAVETIEKFGNFEVFIEDIPF